MKEGMGMKQLADLHEHYVQVEEIATLWGVTPRRVQAMCAAGKLKGAIQVGRSWLIPRDLPKPADGRTKAARTNTDADMPQIAADFRAAGLKI